MATYADLTRPEKEVLQSMINMIRAWTGEQARANNHARAINNDYNAQVSGILATITNPNEPIPNKSGLPGANHLTKDEIISLVAQNQNILTDMSSHTGGFDTEALRQLWTKAGGARATIG